MLCSSDYRSSARYRQLAARGARRARFVAGIGGVGYADTHARRDFRRKLFEHGPSARPERAQPLSIVIVC
ncbi:hypothetical protein [Paraburkholderia strydomiana]|uniref:hypothetical protein n=1 Tax=Paraburkholderia strydomiana TaxID=1245417 RepID=UPI0028576D2C|nr:hypothetical protein [Paraburkholderia strydomiana]MDR7006877.1 hypothetical protein [Paraburkholderia strydomiana]